MKPTREWRTGRSSLPYAGMTRIRFQGCVSAPATAGTPLAIDGIIARQAQRDKQEGEGAEDMGLDITSVMIAVNARFDGKVLVPEEPRRSDAQPTGAGAD
jgi:hypothetical protein